MVQMGAGGYGGGVAQCWAVLDELDIFSGRCKKAPSTEKESKLSLKAIRCYQRVSQFLDSQ